jgi:hypothetical protein
MTEQRRHGGQGTGAGGPTREDPRQWGARLVRLVERQHGLFTTLEGLSGRQSACIDGGDCEALLRVLGERQAVVDQILETGEEMAPLRARWEELIRELDEDVRTSLTGRVTALEDLSRRIAERDERDRLALETRRAALVDDMAGLVRSRHAVAAYGGARPAPAAQFQDRKG